MSKDEAIIGNNKEKQPLSILNNNDDGEINDSNVVMETMSNTFTNPDPSILKDNDSLVWVKMTAIPVYKLSNNVRIPSALSSASGKAGTETSLATELDSRRYTFKFLASQELLENVTHSWEPYESVASMASKAYADFGISIPAQLQGVMQATGKNSIGELIRSLPDMARNVKNTGIIQSVFNALNSVATNGTVANYRVDTPLQYKGSERRNFELMFTLVNAQETLNKDNVALPVKLLMSMSSPSYSNDNDKANADIILPYLFELHTEPGDLICCDLAVLKTVNPTWKGPWIDGQPSRCELRLSFTEYRPLESRVFFADKNNYGKVHSYLKEKRDAYDRQKVLEINSAKQQTSYYNKYIKDYDKE